MRPTQVVVPIAARIALLALVTFACAGTARGGPASPVPALEPLTADAVNDQSLARDSVGDNASSAAILRAQILLDRAGFSVGEIDARYGDNTRRAVAGFQKAHDLSLTGEVDAATWSALADQAPVLGPHTIAADDVAGPFATIPGDMMQKAELPALSYASPLEALAERFHASPALLQHLNPDKRLESGETLLVPQVATTEPPVAAAVVVDGSDLSVSVLDDGGRIRARYPASAGSEHDPLPLGRWEIKGVAWNPTFHYNPDLFWDADRSHSQATLAPGPNNPVGVVWIDLSKEHYGIHGTPEPSRISRTESHGCIRLTNWDATRLGHQVKPGTPALLKR